MRFLLLLVVNLNSIPFRLGPSSVVVIGFACVVTALVSILSAREGFGKIISKSSDPARIAIIRQEATGEANSYIRSNEWDVISRMPGLSDVSGELVSSTRINNSNLSLLVRGVDQASFALNPEITIIKGRNFRTGSYEVIIGHALAEGFEAVELGEKIEFGPGYKVEVVGHFVANGSRYESEIWIDRPVLQDATKRFYPRVVRARLENSDLGMVNDFLQKDARVQDLVAWSEASLYESQSRQLKQLIEFFGYAMALIMGLGVFFGIVDSTLYMMKNREPEMALLRAIGFRSSDIAVATLLETAILATIGGGIAVFSVYMIFDGIAVTTIDPSSKMQISFELLINRDVIIVGFVTSFLLSILCGVVPVISIMRKSITSLLR